MAFQSDAFQSDAFELASGWFTADAFVGGYFYANAVIASGWATLDAVIFRADQAGSFTADAEIRRPAYIGTRAMGNFAGNAATTQVVSIPAGAQRGDLMILLYSLKPYSATPTINQDWQAIGSYADGTVAPAGDVGSMLSGAFWKIHSGSEANPTITWGATSTPAASLIHVFKIDEGGTWILPPVGAGGGDTSAGTGFSATLVSDPGVAAGDTVDIVWGIRSDAGSVSAQAISQAGVTFEPLIPGGSGTTTAGNDGAWSSVYTRAESGSSTAAPVITATLAAAHTGSVFLVRMRGWSNAVPPISFTADARVAGWFLANAVIKRWDQPGSFAVDAEKAYKVTVGVPADAVIKRVQLTSGQYADHVLHEAPVAWFRLRDAVGSSTAAEAVAAKTATLTAGAGGATFGVTNGLFRGATWITGYATTTYYQPSTKAASIECWIKTTATTGEIHNGRTGPSSGASGRGLSMGLGAYGFGAVAGRVNLFINSDGIWQGLTSSIAVNDNQLHHIVGVWQGVDAVNITGSQMAIYIDGVRDTSAFNTSNGAAFTPPVAGYGTGSTFAGRQFGQYTGWISEIAYYAKALSSADVSAHRAAGLGTSGVKADAFVQPYFRADAFVLPWFTVDAEIVTPTIAGDFTAGAFVQPWFTADAYLISAVAGDFSADAFVQPFLTADAVAYREQAGSFSAEWAYIDVVAGSFTADAFVRLTFTASAVIFSSAPSAITADAVARRPGNASYFKGWGVRMKPGGATFTANAVRQLFTVPKTFTANATRRVRDNAGSLTVDALRRWVVIGGADPPTYDTLFEDTFTRTVANGLGGEYVDDPAGWSEGNVSVDGSRARAGGALTYGAATVFNASIPHPDRFDLLFDFTTQPVGEDNGYLWISLGKLWVDVYGTSSTGSDPAAYRISGGVHIGDRVGTQTWYLNRQFAAYSTYRARVRLDGNTAYVRYWVAGSAEPASWDMTWDVTGSFDSQFWMDFESGSDGTTYWLDNLTVRTIPATGVPANADVFAVRSGSFTADAVHETEAGTKERFAVADAVIYRERAGSATADAMLRLRPSGSFSADAVKKKTQTPQQVFADIETEATVAPWVAEQIAGYTYGVASLSVVPQAPTGYGSSSLGISFTSSYQIAHVPLPGTFQSGTTYAVTFRIKAYSGSTSLGRYQIIIGPKNDAATSGRSRVLNLVPPTSWTLRTTYWTPTSTVTDAVLALASYNSYAFGIVVDAVQATAPFYSYAIRRRGWEGTFSASAQMGHRFFTAAAVIQLAAGPRSLTAAAVIVRPGGSVTPLPGKPSVQIWIDGVDYAPYVVWATASFNARVNGSAGDCSFQIIDREHAFSFRFGQEINLAVNGRIMWGGWIQRPERTFLMPVQPFPATSPRTWNIEGVDYNAVFDRRVIHDLSNPDKSWSYAPGTYDDTIINDVWSYFDMDGFTKSIARVAPAILDIPGVTSKSNGGLVASGGFTLREVLTSITRTTAAIFYCSPEKVVTYVDSDAVNSPYVLTDRPFVMEITGADILFEDDFNRVVASGLGNVKGWVEDYVGGGDGSLSVDGSTIVLSGEDYYAYWENPTIPHPAEFDVQFDIYIPADTTYGWGYVYLYMGNIWVQVTSWDDGEIEFEGGISGSGGYFYNQHFATPGNLWYTVKARQTTTQMLAKIWPRDGVEPGWQYQANVTGYADDWAFEWELDAPWYPNREGIRVDNLRVSEMGGGLYTPPVNAVGYREVKLREDITGMVNDALVWGAGYGNENVVFARNDDATSQNSYGLWQAGEFKEGVYKQATVNAVAASYVDGSPSAHRGAKNPKRLTELVTDEPVLGVGDVVRVINSQFDYDDTLPVRTSSITFPTPYAPRFRLGLSWEIDAAWSMYDPWIPADPPPPAGDGGCIDCLPDPPQPTDPNLTWFVKSEQATLGSAINTSDYFDLFYDYFLFYVPNELGPRTVFDTFTRLVTGGWGTSTDGHAWTSLPSGSWLTSGLINGTFTCNGTEGTHAVLPPGTRKSREIMSDSGPDGTWSQDHWFMESDWSPYWNRDEPDRLYALTLGVSDANNSHRWVWWTRVEWGPSGDGTVVICDSSGCTIPVAIHINEGTTNTITIQYDDDGSSVTITVCVNGVCVTLVRTKTQCTLTTYVVDDFDRVVPADALGWTSDLKLQWDTGGYAEINSGQVWVEDTGGPSLPLEIQFEPPISATIVRPVRPTARETANISFTQFPSFDGDVTVTWTEEPDPDSPTGWKLSYFAITLPASEAPYGPYDGPASLTTTSPSPNNPTYTNNLYVSAPAVMDPILDASDVFVTRPITGLTKGQGVDIYITVNGTPYHSDNSVQPPHFTFQYDTGTKLWRMGFEDGGSGAMPPALYPGSGADVFANIDFGDYALTGIFPLGWAFEGFYQLVGGACDLPILVYPFSVTLEILSATEVRATVAGYSLTATGVGLGPFTTFTINNGDLSGM